MKGFFDVPAKDLFDSLTRDEFIDAMTSVGFELEDDFSNSALSFTIHGTLAKRNKKVTKSKVDTNERFLHAS